MNDDSTIDELEVELCVQAYGTEFTDEWIFNLADLVVYGWDYENHG